MNRKQRIRNKKGEPSPDNQEKPANTQTSTKVKISHPIVVSLESKAEEIGRYAEEKNSRAAQVHAAQALNWITLVGAAISIGGLVVLFLTLKQNKDAMITNERAWIFVQETSFHVNNGLPTGIIGIKNTGHTPAFNLTVHECSEVRSSEPINGIPNDPRSCQDRNIGILGPDVPTQLALSDFNHPMTPALAEEFSNRKVRLYFWLYMEYGIFTERGTFNRVRPHHTSACMMTELISNPTPPPTNAPPDQLSPCNSEKGDAN